MAAYVIWDVRVVIRAGNVNKSQNRRIAWRIGGGGSGGGGVNRGARFIHSLMHSLTRSSVHSAACRRTISRPAGPSLHVRHAPRPCLLLHVAGVTRQQISHPLRGRIYREMLLK